MADVSHGSPDLLASSQDSPASESAPRRRRPHAADASAGASAAAFGGTGADFSVGAGGSASSSSSSAAARGGLAASSGIPKAPEEDPQPGVVLRLAEVSGCDVDACYAALVAADGDFRGALRELASSLQPGNVKAREHIRAAMLEMPGAEEDEALDARGGLGRGGGSWVAASVVMDTFERIVPRRFMEVFIALLGLPADGVMGVLAMLLPVFVALLVVIVLLRDLDSFMNPSPSPPQP
eukprot:TRINITY_DN34334_c0_g1_i1.p1 TRINITY_DN34334_c0_g1~~TRINITY_DN34334_c0_g1_i1.p1  ORF type:complete len:238 (-),score=53.63 TRINITY_DN34334_c0_g1_i1:20-733(-)